MLSNVINDSIQKNIRDFVPGFSVSINERPEGTADVRVYLDFPGAIDMRAAKLDHSGLKSDMNNIYSRIENKIIGSSTFKDMMTKRDELACKIHELEAQIQDLQKYKTFYEMYKGLKS